MNREELISKLINMLIDEAPTNMLKDLTYLENLVDDLIDDYKKLERNDKDAY